MSPCRRPRRRCGTRSRSRTAPARRPESRRRPMYNFTYHRPTGLRQAGNMLSKLEEAKLLAGGQTLIPVMKQRLASPTNLIDLNRIEGLSGIELKGRSLVIGAMTRHVEVASSD